MWLIGPTGSGIPNMQTENGRHKKSGKGQSLSRPDYKWIPHRNAVYHLSIEQWKYKWIPFCAFGFLLRPAG